MMMSAILSANPEFCMPFEMAKAQAIVTKTSQLMYLLYLRGLNIFAQAMMTVVTQTKKNMSNLKPGTASLTNGNSPTVAPTIIKTSKIRAR